MQIKNRNLFRITRFFLFNLPLLFRFLGKFRKPAKRLLIIKTDAIGDYILFRNFIEIVKKRYPDHAIDLLGNKIWADLAGIYDSEFVSGFIFISKPDSFYEAPLKTFKLGWRLFKNNYAIVLHPTSTRTFINDGFAGLTAAKQIIGFESDTEMIHEKYKAKTDQFYTERVSLPENVYFEFDRSKYFFETVLKQTIDINGPVINVKPGKKEGIVVFTGAGLFKRAWQADQYLKLIKLIRQHTTATIYLAGSAAEIAIGDFLQQNLPAGTVINLINKTSLPQLIELIGNAELVISNETSAIHIASATKTNCVCILGGGHFNRFAPYPDHIINKPVCVYEKMPCYYCNWLCIYQTPEYEPHPCIANVNLENVWQATLPLLPQYS